MITAISRDNYHNLCQCIPQPLTFLNRGGGRFLVRLLESCILTFRSTAFLESGFRERV